MPKNRERPATYTDDPAKLASEIDDGIAECHGTHNFDEYTADTVFYIGEMRLIADRLRPTGKLGEALHVLARAHTSDDDRTGYKVEIGAVPFHCVPPDQYSEAWAVVRRHLGLATLPKG